MDNPDLGIETMPMLGTATAKPAAKRQRAPPKPKPPKPPAAAAASAPPQSSAAAASTSRPQSAGAGAAGNSPGLGPSGGVAKTAGAKPKAAAKPRAAAGGARRKAPGAKGAAADNLLVTPYPAPEAVASEGRGQFDKELKLMMYGFGDSVEPHPEVIELVEDITLAYLTEVSRRASVHVAARGEQKVTPEDVMFVMRKDPRKLARIRELLMVDKEVRAAKRSADGMPEEVGDAMLGGGGEDGEEDGAD